MVLTLGEGADIQIDGVSRVQVPPALDAQRARGEAWTSWLDRLPRLHVPALTQLPTVSSYGPSR